MKNTHIALITVAAIGVVIIAIVLILKPNSLVAPGQVACTQEAKLCPDGSYVGRTGPKCEFAACPIATSTISETSGITGTVLLGPTCPVVRNPPDPQCADKPYQTKLIITTPDETEVVAQFTSDSKGVFKVAVPPGEYIIRSAPTTNIYPRCTSDTIVVTSDTYVETAISCDTGIR